MAIKGFDRGEGGGASGQRASMPKAVLPKTTTRKPTTPVTPKKAKTQAEMTYGDLVAQGRDRHLAHVGAVEGHRLRAGQRPGTRLNRTGALRSSTHNSDRALGSRRASQATISSHERALERLCKCDVRRVVGAEVLTQLPHTTQET